MTSTYRKDEACGLPCSDTPDCAKARRQTVDEMAGRDFGRVELDQTTWVGVGITSSRKRVADNHRRPAQAP
jgi:hypothetical protein